MQDSTLLTNRRQAPLGAAHRAPLCSVGVHLRNFANYSAQRWLAKTGGLRTKYQNIENMIALLLT
eukprot:scaffold206626_cov27-Tisochrysis_lutea.AAC.3